MSDLLKLRPIERARVLADFTPMESFALFYDWDFWGRTEQKPPPGDWIYWLILAGRGAGKTRSGAEAVREWTKTFEFVNLIGATHDDVREIMILGESGLMAICPAGERPQYARASSRLSWPSGAVSQLFSAEEPDRLRGKQHMKLWCLSGDTNVSMSDGSTKKIADIRPGDLVATRAGGKAVLGHALTNRNATVLRLKSAGGQSLIATSEHPIWIYGKGFIPLGLVAPGMSICVMHAFAGTAKHGIDIGAATTRPWFGFTAKYGNRPTDPSLRASMFTTSTGTRETTILAISNFFRTGSIVRGTSKKSLVRTASARWPTRLRLAFEIRRSARLECSIARNAAANTRAALGTRRAFAHPLASKLPGQPPSAGKHENASAAARRMLRKSAPKNIAREFAIIARRRIGHMNCAPSPAPIAEKRSRAVVRTHDFAATNTHCLFMQTIVSVEKLAERREVFDIAVEGEREFFANGILVHNCDELAAWRHPDAFEQALLGLRLGPKPQAVITTTPRPIKLIKQLVEDKDTIVTRGSTFDNADHLADAFLKRIAARYEGRTIGRQELFAEIVEEAPGALWTRALIERQRLAPSATAAEYAEIVIGVDPPAKSGANADECGILVVGKTEQGAIHVLADLTSQGDTPGQWAARVAAAYRRYRANRVVAEINNGGEMVVEVLRQSDANLPVRTVTATRGKFLRAEPIAAAYERGIVHHLGDFAKLEDQLCTLTPDFDARVCGFSPDRADALVWAIADLIDRAPAQSLLDYYAQALKAP